jgi:hypothetical protein
MSSRIKVLKRLSDLLGDHHDPGALPEALSNEGQVVTVDTTTLTCLSERRPGRAALRGTQARRALVRAGPGLPGGRARPLLADLEERHMMPRAPDLGDTTGPTARNRKGVALVGVVRVPCPRDWRERKFGPSLPVFGALQ